MKKVILKNQNSRTLSRAGYRLCERTKFFVTDGVKKTNDGQTTWIVRRNDKNDII